MSTSARGFIFTVTDCVTLHFIFRWFVWKNEKTVNTSVITALRPHVALIQEQKRFRGTQNYLGKSFLSGLSSQNLLISTHFTESRNCIKVCKHFIQRRFHYFANQWFFFVVPVIRWRHVTELITICSKESFKNRRRGQNNCILRKTMEMEIHHKERLNYWDYERQTRIHFLVFMIFFATNMNFWYPKLFKIFTSLPPW